MLAAITIASAAVGVITTVAIGVSLVHALGDVVATKVREGIG